MDEMRKYTIAVLVDNEAGVLSQISRLFSRKGYNIESLSVGTTTDPAISRMTIEVISTLSQVELLCNQLRKLIPVYSVELLTPQALRRELVLFKVAAKSRDVRNEIIQNANIFRASIIDVSPDTITLAVIGEEEKIDAMQRLLEDPGILELVRTGIAALERGNRTIHDNKKEKGEHDHGKNVL